MISDLRGRAAAITGASAGIGRACAELFAAEGLSVTLAARREPELARIAAEIVRRGGRAVPVVTDVVREEDLVRLVDRTQSEFDRLDVMVCNAGIGFHGNLEKTTPDVMRRLIDVNFMGTYYAARAALRIFQAQGHGHIVIVSSVVGRRGIPFMGGYAATKFAQVGLAESLRSELAGTGVHVTIVFPVSTETEFSATMLRNYGQRYQGTGPRQSAGDVARAIVRCLRKPAPEVYPYPLARGLAIFNVVAPRWCDRFVTKFRRRPIPEDPGAAGP
jgi:short-subunit dehydrogenase